MTSTVRFNVDRLVEIPAEQIAIIEILKGSFDDRIAELKKLIAELKARQSIDQTLEEAEAMFDQAKQKLAEADQILSAHKTETTDLMRLTQAALRDAEANRQASIEEGAKIITAKTLFEAERKNAQELMDQRSAALDLRESQLAATASKIGEEQRQLAVDREAFNRRLEALKA